MNAAKRFTATIDRRWLALCLHIEKDHSCAGPMGPAFCIQGIGQ